MSHVPNKIAAKQIGVQPHTLRVWRMRGFGPPYVRLGGPRGRVVYSEQDIETWLAARRFRSTSEESARIAREEKAA